MKCPRCQHDNPQGARFCEECATPLARTCSNCGTALSATAKFCHACAHPVGGVAGAASRSPDSYTPKHLAEKILSSKSALEGERKLVTVLFCDIAKSTALAERLGPDAMHALLSRFFELALGEVHRYEGTINQFLGDGFMALFGAPVAHEDHARRATLAAVAIRRALGQSRDELALPEGLELNVRMGLNTGLVVVGAIGDNLRMDYTAVGDTTNLAARLQQHAEPGEVLISEATSHLVEGYVRVQAVAPFQAKGKAEPITAFGVVGLGTRRSQVDTEANRTLSQFVGRDRELGILRDVLVEVQAGRGQVVGIVGEPGLGKSRLLYEFRRSLAAAPVTYLEGRCLSYGHAVPYLPLQDIIRDNCGINSTDTPGQIGEKIRVGLEQVGVNPEEGSYLLHLLGVKEGAERLAQIEPQMIKAGISGTLRQMSVNGCRRHPLILAVEDVHWIDKTSEEYFTSAVEWLAGVPILLLTTYRPGYKPTWINKSYATQIALRPLSSQDSLRVVESVVERATPFSESTTQVIIDKADGNPFFLEELTRVALERGRQGTSVTIPDTIQGVLAARIDRLREEPKRVLQTAAVLGREFSPRILKAIRQDAHDLERDLAELKRLEFVYERTGVDDIVYVFKHALIQEVAYESLLTAHRQALHRATGEALETLYADRLEEHYEGLAHHYGRSGSAEKALQKAASYSRHAGQKAVGQSADRAAVAWFERALEALRQLSETAETLEQAIDIRLELRMPFTALGQYQPGIDHLLEAERQARALKDQRRLGRVSASIGNFIWTAGRAMEAHGFASTAVRIGDSLGDVPILVVGNHTLGLSNHILGAYRDAGRAFKKAVEALAEQCGPVGAELRGYPGWCRTFWAVSLAERGEFSEALALAHEGLKIAEELRYNLSIRICSQQVGWVYLIKGDIETGLHHFERALTLPRESDFGFVTRHVTHMVGKAHLLAGRLDKGLACLEHAAKLTEAVGAAPNDSPLLLDFAEAHLRTGQVGPALASAERGLARAREGGERGHEAYAIHVLGDVAARHDYLDVPKAQMHYEAAMSLASELGMHPLVAHCHLGLGRLYGRMGNRHETQEHLTTATTMYRDMGMTYWLEKAEAEVQELGG